jgi:uncharacterized repeat protein (TIGR03806 family)
MALKHHRLQKRSTVAVVGLVLLAVASGCGDETPLTPVQDASMEDVDAGVVAPSPDAGNSEMALDAGVVDAGAIPSPDVVTEVHPQLSAFGLFRNLSLDGGVDGGLIPVDRNVPYQLTTGLFSDYSLKDRTIFIPVGKQARWTPSGVLDFPIGTIITKTFSFAADLRKPTENLRRYETRLLIRQPTGWEAWPYIWNDEQTDAKLTFGGRVFKVAFIDDRGKARVSSHAVPSRNQCQSCHHVRDEAGVETLTPIGPKSQWLSRSGRFRGRLLNQLRFLEAEGLLSGLPVEDPPAQPDAFDPSSGPLNARARAYLDINCGHCHNPKATPGNTSRLFLNLENTSDFALGICKRPGSAGGNVGGTFDILPGDHSTSILWFRTQTEESGKMASNRPHAQRRPWCSAHRRLD